MVLSKRILAIFICVLGVVPFWVDGLYFHISETEKKCFIEEIPEETMVMARYKVQLYDPNTKGYGDHPNIGMHVEIKDPEEKVCFYVFYLFFFKGYFEQTLHKRRHGNVYFTCIRRTLALSLFQLNRLV